MTTSKMKYYPSSHILIGERNGPTERKNVEFFLQCPVEKHLLDHSTKVSLLMKKYIFKFIEDIENHEIFIMAAAIAYATALALAPFILIIFSIVAVLDPHLQDQLSRELSTAVGREAGEIIRAIIENIDKSSQLSGISGLIGFSVLVVSASIIFSQLRIALDKINEYQAPPAKNEFLSFLKNKFLSLGLVLGFAFLSIASLLLTAFIAVIYPDGEEVLWNIISFIISFLLFTGLFTAIFRFIPSEKYPWSRCFISGVVSTVFYAIGKGLISIYLGKAGIGSSYGAAGSLIVFLAWVYYIAVTILISYEISVSTIHKKINLAT